MGDVRGRRGRGRGPVAGGAAEGSFEECPGRPDPRGGPAVGQQLVPVQIHAGAGVAEAQLPAQRTEAEWMNMARRVYIRKDVELAKHGYTPGCDGCTTAMAGLRPPTNKL